MQGIKNVKSAQVLAIWPGLVLDTGKAADSFFFRLLDFRISSAAHVERFFKVFSANYSTTMATKTSATSVGEGGSGQEASGFGSAPAPPPVSNPNTAASLDDNGQIQVN